MSDCATKAKQSAPQHEGRVVISTGTNGQYQTRSPITEKITDVLVIETKYTNYYDDYSYYTA